MAVRNMVPSRAKPERGTERVCVDCGIAIENADDTTECPECGGKLRKIQHNHR